jgi:prophage regulatory protein
MEELLMTELTASIGYLRLPQILKLFPVSKSTWWQGVKDGKFPKPVKLTERTTAWRAQDILDLLDSVGGHKK